jgi:trk system potassium uptake protein TrkH
VVSVATTTGYATTDYAQWPLFAPLLMILLGCFATCAGSTGGGIKMIRMLLLLKQARRELVRIVHPRAVQPGHLLGTRGPAQVLSVGDRLHDDLRRHAGQPDAAAAVHRAGRGDRGFTAVIACVNNIGPGLGEVGPAVNFQGLTDFQTWVCTLGMLLGRLELLSVLVLFTPQFWRK